MSSISLISLVVVLMAINWQLISSNELSCPIPLDEKELSSLEAVYILMRHGIRSPGFGDYPLDPFAKQFNSRYPRGKEQLTDSGIEQAYNMGKFIKNKYQPFLEGKKKSVYLRSSPVQRCIDTLSIVTKNIWLPEVGDKKWWQPMIFSLPKELDKVFYDDRHSCKPYAMALENSLLTQEVKDYESDPKIQEIYNFTAEKTGLPPNMDSLITAFDTIKSEKYNGLQSPDWVTPQIYERMGEIFSKYYYFVNKMTKVQRFRAGPILKDFINQMDKVINSKPGDMHKDVFLYATHEFKISAILFALGDPHIKYPSFLSTLIFELHRIDGKHIVRAHYVDNTTEWPFNGIKLNLTKCKQQGASSGFNLSKIWPPSTIINGNDQECTFDNFVASVSELTSVDWEKECGTDTNPYPIKAAENSLGNTGTMEN